MLDTQKFLNDLRGDNIELRFQAWRAASEAPASAIPEIGKIAASDNPGVAKAGKEALTTLAHSVGKDPASPNRAAVSKGLTELALSSPSVPVKAHALWLLSHIGGDDCIPTATKFLADTNLREEAAFCLERIPTPAAAQALLAAYKSVPDDFKPRILAAVGHRRVKEGAPLCLEAMKSSNAAIAAAAQKAYARIGSKTAPVPAFDQPEQADSGLRFAEAMLAQGDLAESLRIYKTVLNRPEPHLQCAAVIGLAKIGTPEALTLLLPQLKSQNRTVRLTTQSAWKKVAG